MLEVVVKSSCEMLQRGKTRKRVSVWKLLQKSLWIYKMVRSVGWPFQVWMTPEAEYRNYELNIWCSKWVELHKDRGPPIGSLQIAANHSNRSNRSNRSTIAKWFSVIVNPNRSNRSHITQIARIASDFERFERFFKSLAIFERFERFVSDFRAI